MSIISVGDNQASFGLETNTSGIITYNIGNVISGEGFNGGAVGFRPAGLISRPNGPGSFYSTVDGYVFNNALTSNVSAKLLAIENGNLWQIIGMMDIRSSSQLNVPVGETVLFPEANPSCNILLNINGDQIFTSTNNINMTAKNNINLTSSANNITLISTTINLGSSSPNDAVASAMKTDTNFNDIISAATAAAAAALPNDGGKTAFTTFAQNLQAQFTSTASQVVKISG